MDEGKKIKVKTIDIQSSSLQKENQLLYEGSSDENPDRHNVSDAKCFYCDSIYSMDNKSVCCKLWAHEECSGVETTIFFWEFRSTK